MLLCACHGILAHFQQPKLLKVRNAVLKSQEHPDLDQYTVRKPRSAAFYWFHQYLLHITVSETP